MKRLPAGTVLGPCRCSVCGVPLYWDSWAWRQRTGNGQLRSSAHRCSGVLHYAHGTRPRQRGRLTVASVHRP